MWCGAGGVGSGSTASDSHVQNGRCVSSVSSNHDEDHLQIPRSHRICDKPWTNSFFFDLILAEIIASIEQPITQHAQFSTEYDPGVVSDAFRGVVEGEQM